MGVLENVNRIGCISSSNAYLLMDKGRSKANVFGVACETYLQKLKRERKFKASLEKEINTRPMSWGSFIELYYAENKLPIGYVHIGDKTYNHKTIEGWVGTPDFISADCVDEFKAYEPINFTKYADVLSEQNIELFKAEFKKEYWQIVSNACVLDLKYGSAIAYMPYLDELKDIATMADQYDGENMWSYKFIYDEFLNNPENPNLPFIPKESCYKNENIFRFEIPQEDKDELTKKIELGLKIINN